MTAREHAFFSALSPEIRSQYWYFCPHVHVADIVNVSPVWKKGGGNGGVYLGLFHSGIAIL